MLAGLPPEVIKLYPPKTIPFAQVYHSKVAEGAMLFLENPHPEKPQRPLSLDPDPTIVRAVMVLRDHSDFTPKLDGMVTAQIGMAVYCLRVIGERSEARRFDARVMSGECERYALWLQVVDTKSAPAIAVKMSDDPHEHFMSICGPSVKCAPFVLHHPGPENGPPLLNFTTLNAHKLPDSGGSVILATNPPTKEKHYFNEQSIDEPLFHGVDFAELETKMVKGFSGLAAAAKKGSASIEELAAALLKLPKFSELYGKKLPNPATFVKFTKGDLKIPDDMLDGDVDNLGNDVENSDE